MTVLPGNAGYAHPQDASPRTRKREMASDRNREFKYYQSTEWGRKQLLVEESQWKQMVEAVARVMLPAAEES